MASSVAVFGSGPRINKLLAQGLKPAWVDTHQCHLHAVVDILSTMLYTSHETYCVAH